MTDANGIFNTSGKIPTDSDFWAQDIEWANEVGFTKYFSKVLGEQVFAPLKKPQLAFYNAFAGRPITAGKGWTERILKKSVAKHFKPNASAEDDLKFYESQGYEWYFGVNTGGWRPVSIPSDLESIEVMLKRDGVGQLNSMLVDNSVLDYQRDVESEIQMKLVTTCKNSVDVNPTDYVGLIHKINDIVTEMKGTTTHYNDVTTYRSTGETINDNIYTNSDEVFVFIYAGLLKKIQESLGGMPSPEKLAIDGKIIPLVDPLPAPLTTEEWTAGQSAQGWDDNIEPSNLDGDAPLVLICSSKRCEYRPLLDGYKMNMSKNGAGDFTNVHLVWRAGLAIRPWENCCLINGDESITDETPAIIVKDIGSSRSEHSITTAVTPDDSGYVTASADSAVAGTIITLTATPAEGYTLTGYTSVPEVEITDNTFVMPAKDIEITATFERLYNITVAILPDDTYGTVTVQRKARAGEIVPISAEPADGKWCQDLGTTQSPYSLDFVGFGFRMPAKDIEISAVFGDDPTGDVDYYQEVRPEDLITDLEAGITTIPEPPVSGGVNTFACNGTVTGKAEFEKWTLEGRTADYQDYVLEVGDRSTEDYHIPIQLRGCEVRLVAHYKKLYPIMLNMDPVSPTPSVYNYTTLNRQWHVDASSVIPSGYHFVRWETTSEGVTIEDPSAVATTIDVGGTEPEDGKFYVTIVVEAD